MVEIETIGFDVASRDEFKAALGEAILGFGVANAECEGDDATLVVAVMTATLLQAAWCCAQQCGLSPDQFAQAAMVEANAPASSRPVEPRPVEQRPWPN